MDWERVVEKRDTEFHLVQEAVYNAMEELIEDPEEGLETVGYYVRLVCLNCGKVGPKNFKTEGEEVERRENVEANCCDSPEKVYRSNAVVPVEDILEKIEDTEEIDELEKHLRGLLTDN